MLLAGILVIFIVLGCFLNLLRIYSKALSDCKHLPCMKSWHLIGDVPKMFGNNIDFFKNIMQFSEEYREKGLLCLWFGLQPAVLVFKDKYVHEVIGNTKHIEKSFFYKLLESWLGNGLLTSTGSKWFKARKMLTPSFHYNILNNFLVVMRNQSNILCNQLDKMVGKGEFDIRPCITNFALDTITETAMGKCVDAQINEHSEYIENVNRISDIISYQSKSPWLWPEFLFKLHPLGRETAKCLKYLHDFTDKMIEERSALYLKNTTEKYDNEEGDIPRKKTMAFLDTLLDNLHKGELDKKSLREEVDTFMFEGHDTTAAGISWTIYFIAAYPDVQKKLQKEVDEFYDENEELTLQNIKKLVYLECVIKEVQRLYPSVPIIGRVAAENFKIGPHDIKQGTPISILISSLHRDPQNFPDPDIFDPDRFLQEDTDRSSHAFIPFSAGPRNCIVTKELFWIILTMVYMQIKEQTADKLHLCREPNSWSWCLLFGVVTGSIGAIYYGSDHFLWKIFWLLGALLLGLTAMEDWEDCIFEKSTGVLTIKKRSLLQRFLHPLLKQHVVKASLDDIVGVRVEEREMKYLGKGNQVVVLLAAGAIIGITESFTIGDSSDHYAIAHKIQDFLEVDMNRHHDPNDGDDYLGDSSSSEDSFEQIGPQYVQPENSNVAANTENMYKM